MDRLRGSKLHLSLFGFSHEEWTQTCQMYFSLKKAVQNKYLQWFPFSKLSTADIERIKSKSFYDTYIKNGGFLYNNKAVFVTDNYILKTDNSFRDMKLVSGFIFLVLQAIGLSASKKYISRRPKEISAYYAGNYFELRPFYKKEYNKFFKEINRELSEYQYYIKTDVHSFFSNININKLITCLDENCNRNKIRIPPINLHIWKEFLSFCGRGKFPEVENSMASSFFSTVVYLEKLDCLLFEYLLKQDEIQNFKMIRYVDDLYILFNSDLENTNLETIYNKICSYISSVIKDFDLSLNYEKCSISETKGPCKDFCVNG